jgi:hypothetical protein
MRRMLRWTVTLMIAVALFASGALLAQTTVPRFLQRDFKILSGSDVGFRVEGTDSGGRPTGRWMVRIDGQWVEAVDAPTARRATH